MTLTPRGRRAAVALTLTCAAVAGATAQHWDPYARHVDACRTFDVPETDAGWSRALQLRAAGWFSRSDDHAERLYARSCR